MLKLCDGGYEKKTEGKSFFTIGESSAYKIVKMIMERNLAPVIVFSFSKKDCEAYAMQMTKLDFNTGMLPLLSQYPDTLLLYHI